jgi:HSP20 family protein
MAGLQYWDPFEELKRIQERMNRIFGEMGGEPGMRGMEMPSVDVQEHENSVIVTADMPGLDKDDIKLDVRDNNVLEISGHRKYGKEEKEKEKGFVRHERGYKGYYRAISLPTEVDLGKASATYNNGVLTVTLPAKEKREEKRSRIPIN